MLPVAVSSVGKHTAQWQPGASVQELIPLVGRHGYRPPPYTLDSWKGYNTTINFMTLVADWSFPWAQCRAFFSFLRDSLMHTRLLFNLDPPATTQSAGIIGVGHHVWLKGGWGMEPRASCMLGKHCILRDVHSIYILKIMKYPYILFRVEHTHESYTFWSRSPVAWSKMYKSLNQLMKK